MVHALREAEGLAEARGVAEDVLERLRVTADPGDLAPCDLVIEAVPEDAALKAQVLALAERLAPEAVLASNTSSLSIGGLAAALASPDRFLGLHFFNPVPVSELIEIVTGPRTDPALVTRARDWAMALGKTPITVADSPGFASSRLGVCLALEAMRMLEEGVAARGRHRHGDDPRLPPPDGTAADHRRGRPRRAARHRRAPVTRARPPFRAAADPARPRRRRAPRPQDGPGLLHVVSTGQGGVRPA